MYGCMPAVRDRGLLMRLHTSVSVCDDSTAGAKYSANMALCKWTLLYLTLHVGPYRI